MKRLVAVTLLVFLAGGILVLPVQEAQAATKSQCYVKDGKRICKNTAKTKQCAICGRPAVGWCHMRKINVCETHRYFTQNGVNWRCP